MSRKNYLQRRKRRDRTRTLVNSPTALLQFELNGFKNLLILCNFGQAENKAKMFSKKSQDAHTILTYRRRSSRNSHQDFSGSFGSAAILETDGQEGGEEEGSSGHVHLILGGNAEMN